MTDDLTHNWTVFEKLFLTRLDLTSQGVFRLKTLEISQEHQQRTGKFEICNSVRDAAGQAYPDNKSVANGLASNGRYQSSSRFNFSFMNRSILKRVRNVIHGCRSSDLEDPMLAKPFSSQEFLFCLSPLGFESLF
ncbi:hypothetical protein TNIN_387901 [Trichonephila inaurata madagascariensis]|uniref:Uncharacterized protein n=1 Tax=Trichonephila inaurata madagascariensis TaxID=2747483 RepID=A0A8X6ISY2_9ARAC|nr:hypothetical protein TNIN_387901 [Trichonephila inaurata madagascariensis]